MLTKDVHGNNHMISIHMEDGIFMNLFHFLESSAPDIAYGNQ